METIDNKLMINVNVKFSIIINVELCNPFAIFCIAGADGSYG